MSNPGSPVPEPQTEALLERLAARVVEMRMSVPAVLFLESVKPLSFIGSQALAFFEPMVRVLFRWDDLERLRVALEDRANIERLLVKIEDKEAGRHHKRPPGKGSA